MGRIRVNQAALRRAIDTPQARAALRNVGETVAANVRAQGIKIEDENGGPGEVPLPVNVYDGTGPDPKVRVVLSHAAGLAVQAKHGSLTKAAAAAGLKVTGGRS